MSGILFVTLLCFRLLKYMLTMVVCMCFMFAFICASSMVLGFESMAVVWAVLLYVVCCVVM